MKLPAAAAKKNTAAGSFVRSFACLLFCVGGVVDAMGSVGGGRSSERAS
jgi:hypothetical protein